MVKRSRTLLILFVLAVPLWVLAVGLPVAAAQNSPGEPVSLRVNLEQPPVAISRELLGQFIPNPRMQAFSPTSSQNATAGVATYLRGLYGAFYAEFYDWRDPLGLNDPLRPPTGAPEIENQLGTLDYLRLAAANGAAVSLNVNMRGVRDVFSQPLVSDLTWVMTDTAVLASWAADWVHYVNYTVQHFDTAAPPDPASGEFLEAHSAQILMAITWQNRDGSQVRPELPEPGEELPLVTYWEIGNEPNYPLSGFRLLPEEFARRYLEITEAMIARDLLINGTRTIKVGPSLTATYPPNRNSINDYLAALERVGAVVDFIGYHPYTTLFGDWETLSQNTIISASPGRAAEYTPADVDQLRTILSGLYGFHQTLAISTTLAVPAGVELWATEWNPSSWESGYADVWKAKSMAQSLGVLETLFSFARLGLRGAVFFADPAFQQNDRQQPLYETFRFLEEHFGEELLAVYDGGAAESTAVRAYVTRRSDSGELVFWVLNWSETPVVFDFEVSGVARPYVVGTRCTMSGQTLLHGAYQDPRALPLPAPLEVACRNQAGSPAASLEDGAEMVVRMVAPANGWTAVILRPAGWGLTER